VLSPIRVVDPTASMQPEIRLSSLRCRSRSVARVPELHNLSSSWADVNSLAGLVHCFCPSPPITCPSRNRAGAMDAAKGSIRQRGSGSFELRVYRGTDPSSGRRRWLTRTVRGDRSAALRELKALAVHANIAPAVGAHTTVAALLDQWFAGGRSTWSPTTTRNLTSIVERHLKPGLGDILVGDLTTAIVDGFYNDLRAAGRIDGKPGSGLDGGWDLMRWAPFERQRCVNEHAQNGCFKTPVVVSSHGAWI
jgi:Phage integrase, N-terminal SAM-like domain